ncbi:NADH:ubiquinone oxidoreductase subunit NDUFA12 [Novosphingopyxis sp.]|uniref:NADH:ubiquinone oxidoreductase subunit NDUFA12 n=1 Tax=Novosphingopyxis sp. TaxID=2709690 RepID=UPI003B59EDD1
MSFFGKIFTWWNGATIGTALYNSMHGTRVGEDHQGNVYFREPAKRALAERRWVIYNGANDASRVPPEWHGWLHGTFDEEPESYLPPARIWEKEPTGNLTGTPNAYRPAGALEKGGHRARATGDYEAWTPGDA